MNGRVLPVLLVCLCGCAHPTSVGPLFPLSVTGSRAVPDARAVARHCDGVVTFPTLVEGLAKGGLDGLRQWLDQGGNPGLTSPDATPLLLAAAASGCRDAVSMLVAAGADPAAVDADGAGMLHYAARARDSLLLEQLLDGRISGFQPPAPNGPDALGRTPLLHALSQGPLSSARLLLAHGADPSAADVEGLRPLLQVCKDERPDAAALARLLVEAGADPALPGPDGRSPLLLALDAGQDELARYLLSLDVPLTASPHGITPVMAAAAGALPDLLALLATEGQGRLRETDARGWTPLRFAACADRRAARRDALVSKLLQTNPPGQEECAALLDCAVLNDLPESFAALSSLCANRPDPEETLLAAAKACSPGMIARLVGPARPAGPSIRKERSPLDKALLRASRQGCAEVVSLLLDAGASAGARTARGNSPIDLALAGAEFLAPQFEPSGGSGMPTLPRDARQPRDFGRTMAFLLDAEASTGMAEESNLLSLAVQTGSVDVVRVVLERRGLQAGRSARGLNALSAAALSGGPAVLRILLQAGAPADGVDSSGQTPVTYAAQAGSLDSTCLLLAAGADIDSPDPRGETPLHHAARFGRPDLVELLLAAGARAEAKRSDGRVPLHLAAASGNVPTVELLLRSSGNAAPADRAGVTPLHLAAGGGHLAVLQRLLAAGADPLAMDHRGLDALCFAAAGGAESVIVELLERNVPAGGSTPPGAANPPYSPLLLAVQGSHVPAARRLLQAGADVEVRNAAGWTPLMLAAYSGNLPLVRLLLENKASLDASDRSGWTALTAAVRSGAAQTACALIEAGADPTPAGGPDLRRLAARTGNQEIQSCLGVGQDSIDSKDPPL